ncbi:hypothetical protein AUC69_11685 [Methyloceanibacter superfactus]|uniref:Uncharacterized protein n=1 Tax=Methyloceanibacter superfactus TaxID=1774969 RepID=A0A1E3VWV5_9HYPH|nr:hypothetical protein AUC69_11685 [Methyloceanibacter superfactus]
MPPYSASRDYDDGSPAGRGQLPVGQGDGELDLQGAGAKDSQALAVQSAHEVKRARGWSHMSMSARRVKGDPFWKAVRPGDPPPDALLKPDIVTSRFFTTCFTGVVVPVVCTTGSAVCGN